MNPVIIFTSIAKGGQKFVDQVAVRSMDLKDAKASLAGPARSCGKRSDHFLNAIKCERLRNRIVVGEWYCARGHDLLPTAFAFGNCARSFPRPVCAGFAAGMSQLHSSHAPLFMNETDDSAQHFDVLVGPDTEVLRTDASLGENGRCLGQDQSGAPYRTAAEMNEMPVVSDPSWPEY